MDFIKPAKANSFVIKVRRSTTEQTPPVGARREGDAHCGAGESTPVYNLATRITRRARRRASRLTPCGWRERQPSSRSAMARTKWSHKTTAEKAAALAVAVEQRDAQCAAAAARRAKRTSWAAIDLLMMG